MSLKIRGLSGVRGQRRPLMEALENRSLLAIGAPGLSITTLNGVSTEAGGAASLSVRLLGQPGADVTVPLAVSNTAVARLSASSVVFTPANWATPQVVTATGLDDQVVTADIPYQVTSSPTLSADPLFRGLISAPSWLTNVNMDRQGVVVAPGQSLAGGASNFSVVLSSKPTASVTIGVSSSAPKFGVASTTALVFSPTNWDNPQVVTVTPPAGSPPTAGSTFQVVTAAAVSTDPVYNSLKPADVTVTNGNGTPPSLTPAVIPSGVAVSAGAGLVTTKAGGTATFTVALNSAPTATVTVGLTPGDGTQGKLSTSTLTFSPANWNVAQTVTVAGLDDLSGSPSDSYRIVASAAVSADPGYDGLVVPAVEVVNTSQTPHPRQLLELAARQEADLYIAARTAAPKSHAGDSGMEAEHQMVFALVDFQAVTNVAILSGNWSDPSIWSNQEIPGDVANVWIMPGRTVHVDGVSNVALRTVRVTGVLQFDADRDTQLKADTVVVDPKGTLLMGTAAAPIQAANKAVLLFADSGPIDRAWDPLGFSRGLISHGTVQIHGTYTTGHIALARAPKQGDTTLDLADAPVNWKVGDSLVVTGARNGQDEPFTIAGLSPDGLKVTLDRPTLYDHTPPAAGLTLYVANTTRNAVFTSENTNDIDRRAHVMFMHNPSVQVDSAGFYGLGRSDKSQEVNPAVLAADGSLVPGTGTNVRGRYSVHFHRTGNDVGGPPAMLVNCAAVDNPGWAFVNHSSNVIMRDNVAYKGMGAQFVTEAGDETGVMDGNIAIGAVGDGRGFIAHPHDRYVTFDVGKQGHGFWFQGVGVVVQNNVVSGAGGAAYAIYPFVYKQPDEPAVTMLPASGLRNPLLAGRATTVRPDQIPFYFVGNEGFASATGVEIGFSSPGIIGGQSLLASSTMWNVDAGVLINYADTIHLKDDRFFRTYGTPVQTNGNTLGGVWGDLAPGDMQYTNLSIEGFQYGIRAPYLGVNSVTGGFYNNAVNIVLSPALEIVNPASAQRFLDIKNVAWGTMTAAQLSGVKQVDILMIQGFPGAPTLAQNLAAGQIVNFFEKDRVLLDGRQLYFDFQAPDYVVKGTQITGVDGLTNAQLWSKYKLALGGAVTPSDAAATTSGARLQGGLIGTAAPDLPGLLFKVVYNKPKGWLPDIGFFDASLNKIKYFNAALNPGYNLVPVTDGAGNRRTLIVPY